MLNFNVKDKVKVFEKNLFFNKINKVIFGTIEKIEEWKQSDGWGELEYDCYRIFILIGDKNIIIEDNFTKVMFRKYEFEITN